MFAKLKSMLVEDWNQAHKWYSMWGIAAIAAAPHAANALASVITSMNQYGLTVPKPMAYAMTALAVLAGLGRLVKQAPPPQ